MSKTTHYRQCLLQKRLANSRVEMTTFLPREFAVVGSVVKLRQDDDSWEDGWHVMHAGQLLPAAAVESDEMLYRRARKNSDMAREGRSLKG
jgi:hypothetical protein